VQFPRIFRALSAYRIFARAGAQRPATISTSEFPACFHCCNCILTSCGRGNPLSDPGAADPSQADCHSPPAPVQGFS